VLAVAWGRVIGDPDEAVMEQKRVHVYFGRYMGWSRKQIQKMESTEVNDYVLLLVECIKAEAPKPGGGAGPSGTGRR
jgi:hypothetical protein